MKMIVLTGGTRGIGLWMAQGYPRLLALLLLALLVCSCSAVPIREYVDPSAHLQPTPGPYYLYTPEDYSPDKEWPVFVGIHPEGGTGLDCWNTWQPFADEQGFVLVCPSLAEENGSLNRQTGIAALIEVLNQVALDASVQDKFFFAGYSAGGQFVEAVLDEYPQLISGAAILAAPGYFPPGAQASHVPVLVIIGQSEDPAAVQAAQLYVDQLRRDGFTVTAEFPFGLDHRLTNDMVKKTLELYRQVYQNTP